jgi:hypothetical protein
LIVMAGTVPRRCLSAITVITYPATDPGVALDRARQLDARAHSELGVDVAKVSLDRLGAEHELFGDLAIRAAVRDEIGDLALAR